jgi:ankyrin repeat protein
MMIDVRCWPHRAIWLRRLDPVRHVALTLAALSAVLFAGCRPHPSEPLSQAAWEGDLGRLRALLARTPADAPDGDWTALVWAARGGQSGAIDVLLQAGADPNRRDTRNGWTPIMHALHTRHAAAARLLLARGADGRIGSGGNSPLEMAALDDDTETMKLLLAAGPPPDQKARALSIAVSGGVLVDIDRPLFGSCHPDAVRLLLQADPAFRFDDAGFGSPLWWARSKGCREVLGLVAHRAPR